MGGRREGENGTNINVYHAIESQTNLESLSKTCKKSGLKVNEKKTQLLAISADRDLASVYMSANGSLIQSESTLKLLGFVFSDRPNVNAQVENLVNRAAKRVFVLRYYSEFMKRKDLIKLYCSLVRSVFEYSSVTYHFLLNKTQENRLGNIQKRCLKCIFGGVLQSVRHRGSKNSDISRPQKFRHCFGLGS